MRATLKNSHAVVAGLTPADWKCSYHEAARADEALADEVMRLRPNLVAISALTASIEEAYRFSDFLRRRGAKVALGGLHATACPDEAQRHCDAVVVGDGEPVWRNLLDDAHANRLRPLYRSQAPFDLSQSPVPRFSSYPTRFGTANAWRPAAGWSGTLF